MLGLHFVLGGIPARSPLAHTKPRCSARLPDAQRYWVNRDLAFVIPSWHSCVIVARGGGARSEEDEWAEVVFGDGLSFPQRRRDAERFSVGVISPRLCVSAGFGLRYCVVEFLFYRAAGCWVGVTEQVLGGRSMGFSPCFPLRSSPPHWRAVSVS